MANLEKDSLFGVILKIEISEIEVFGAFRSFGRFRRWDVGFFEGDEVPALLCEPSGMRSLRGVMDFGDLIEGDFASAVEGVLRDPMCRF